MEVKNKKRSSFTLNDKFKIIQDIENGGSQAQICAKLKLSKSTVSNIWKNRHKIKNDWNINASKRKMRPSSYPDVEEMLYKWFLQAKANNIPLTGPMLQVKAEEFARLTGKVFKCSNGWLDRFKKRHNIQFGKMCASLSASVVQNWTGQIWPAVSKDFTEDNIFNATETGVYYKMTPDKTFLFKNEKCRDGKLSKDRITVMLCANCSGTEKRKLLIIGKSPNPRSFANIKSLPVDYVANPRAWMTAAIFEDYLKKWDLELVKDDRKILLVLDRSPAHLEVPLQNIELAFLPANTSLILQPLHQGVVWNLKQLYRKHVLLRIIEMQENNDEPVISTLDAVNLMHLAWDTITARTIHNCFAHCGLVKSSLAAISAGADNEDIPLSEWLRIMHLMDINEFVEYVNIDNQIHTTEELAEPEIDDSESHLDDTESEEEEDTITSAQALKYTRQLRRYFQTEGASSEAYVHLNKLETTLQNDFLNVQSNRTEYFQ